MRSDAMELEDLRRQIDEIDEELVEVISRRLSIMPEVAEIKRSQNVGIDQEEREREVLENIRRKAGEKGLDPDFVERIMIEIISESKKIQQGGFVRK